MRRAPLVLTLVPLLCLSTSARAAELKIIANASVKASEISVDDLKGVFLVTKTTLSDGSPVQPVLAKSGAAHETLLKEYVGKSDAALMNYYRSLAFTGKATMPKAFGSDVEVAEYVAKTKGAIGYVSAAAAAPGVKTLTVK